MTRDFARRLVDLEEKIGKRPKPVDVEYWRWCLQTGLDEGGDYLPPEVRFEYQQQVDAAIARAEAMRASPGTPHAVAYWENLRQAEFIFGDMPSELLTLIFDALEPDKGVKQ